MTLLSELIACGPRQVFSIADEAKTIVRILEQHSIKDAASKLGVSENWIRDRVRISKYPKDILERLDAREITQTQAFREAQARRKAEAS